MHRQSIVQEHGQVIEDHCQLIDVGHIETNQKAVFIKGVKMNHMIKNSINFSWESNLAKSIPPKYCSRT